MSARDALPTGLALGASHLPSVPLRPAVGTAVTLFVLAVVTRRRSRGP